MDESGQYLTLDNFFVCALISILTSLYESPQCVLSNAHGFEAIEGGFQEI